MQSVALPAVGYLESTIDTAHTHTHSLYNSAYVYIPYSGKFSGGGGGGGW